MVQGGLPVGSSVVLQGPPGQEKLRFALLFLAEGLKSGGNGLVVTSSQSPDAVIAELRELGVNLDSVTNESRLRVVDWYSWSEETVHDIEERGIVIRSSIDLTNLGVALSRAIAALAGGQPRRAVIELLSPATSSYEVTQVYAFAQSAKRKFDRHSFTSLVLLEKEMHSGPQLTTLHQPFDGVIEIERTRSGDRIVRKIGVLHLKDTAPDPTFRVLEISEAGMRVVQDTPKSTAPVSSARGSVLESQDERGQRLRLILQIATERLKLNPSDADALFAMAAAQATLDDAKGGLQTLDRLVALDSMYPGLWVLKTKLHAKLGQADLARQSRVRAQQSEPEAAKVIDAIVPCPMCDAPVAIDATTCANCGVKFTPTRTLEDELDDLGHAAIQEMVEEELRAEGGRGPSGEEAAASGPKSRPERAAKPERKLQEKLSSKGGLTNGLVLKRRGGPRSGKTNGVRGRTNGLRGRTNGLTNGLGRTNGLTNGVGRTNGLTNGLGRTNGLTNGLGRTNGLTNGLGRTNGITNGLGRTNGLTNGLGGSRSTGFHPSGRRGMIRNAGWKLYLIPLVAASLLLMPLFLVPGYQGPAYPIQIDGQFNDWASVSTEAMTAGAVLNPNVDVVRFGVVENLGPFAFYVEVAGSALLGGGPSPGTMDAVRIFVDIDGFAATGYRIDGFGADRMIEVSGYGGAVLTSTLWEFDSNRDPRDWNGWIKGTPAAAAASGSRIEAQAEWLAPGPTSVPVIAAVHTSSWDGRADRGDFPVSPTVGTLSVAADPEVPDVISGSGVSLLRLNLTARGQSISLDSLQVEIVGTATSSSVLALRLLDGGTVLEQVVPASRDVSFSFPALSIGVGATATLSIVGDFGATTGETFGVRLPSAHPFGLGASVVSLRENPGPRTVGYLGSVPPVPAVDGAFAEWSALLADATNDVAPRANSDIDLGRYGAQRDGPSTFLYTDVSGRIFRGTSVPEPPREAPPPGPSVPPDTDRDTVPDISDPLPLDFNNDGVPDAQSNGDYDGDGMVDYGHPGGTDNWLNTTLPSSFPPPYAGRFVTVYIGPTENPPVLGEDVLRIFLDIDNVSWTGYAIGGIGADRLVEIRGKDGRVTGAALLSFSGSFPGQWAWAPISPVTVALGYHAVELVVSLTAANVYVEAGDFWGSVDSTVAGPALVPQLTSFKVSSAANPLSVPWIQVGPEPASTLVDGNSNVATTTYNHQRKVVRAGNVPVDTTCDATNSDGCWYVVFYDQFVETTNTAPSTETITKGSKVSGTFPTDVQTSNNAYIQYREANQAPVANHTFVEQTTRQTTTSTSYVDITGASIASSSFTAGRKYLLVFTAQLDSSSTTKNAFIRAVHGTTEFPGSEFSFETDDATSRYTFYWFVVWTAVSGESVTLQFQREPLGSATIGADQVTMFKLDLGGLTESTDWFFSGDTAGDTISGATWDGLASVTFTPSTASDWLVMTTMRGDPDGFSRSFESRIARSGEAAETQPLTKWNGNNVADDRYVQTLARVFSLTGVSNTFTQESRCSASCTYPRSYSSVFALSLDKFEDRTSVWTEPQVALSTTDWGTQVQTASMTPSRAGDVWVVGQFAVNGTTTSSPHKFRLQVDNVDQPGSQTTDAYSQWDNWETNDEVLSAIQTVESLAASAHTFDLDASRGGNGATAEDRVIFAISMVLRDYELEIRHDWSGIAAGSSTYTLNVEAHHVAGEDFLVEVLTPPSTWIARITITKTADDDTAQTYTLTTAEFNSGAPSIRFLGNVEAADTTQSDLYVDYIVVSSINTWDRIMLMRSSDTSGSTWGTQIVLASGRTGDSALLLTRDSAEPSVAIDAGGFLHVVWVAASAAGDQSTMNLVRHTKTTVAYPTQSELANAANWDTVTNVDDANPGYMPTASTDASNNPHIAWSGSKTSGTVYYRNKAAGTWRSTVSWGVTYTGISVDVSPQNNYVSLARYYEASTNEIQYLVCKDLSTSNCDDAAEFTKADGTSGSDTVATTSAGSAFLDGASVAIGTTETTLGSLATILPAGDNYIIVTVALSTIPQSTVSDIGLLAGNFKVKRGAAVLASNQFLSRAGGTAPDADDYPTNYLLLLAKDAGAPANPTYDVTALADATGMNGEVKIIVLQGLVATFEDGGSVAIGASESTLLAHAATGLPSGDNLIIAAFSIEDASTTERAIAAGDLRIKRGVAVLSGNEFAIDMQLDARARRTSGVLLLARDAGAPADPTYTMTASRAGGPGTFNGEVKVIVISNQGGISHSLTDSGSVAVGTSETTIGTVATTFAAGDNVVIASNLYENTPATAQRDILAGSSRIVESGGVRSTNQFEMRLGTNVTANEVAEVLLWRHAGAGASPSYDTRTLASATDINGETKIAVIHVKDAGTAESLSYPSLATTYEANGDLWVAYAKGVDSTTRAIYARFLDYPSAGWQAATTVDSLSGTIFTRPSIGIDSNNDVHALYVATSGPQLYYNKRSSGSWGTREAVGTSTDNPTLMVRGPNDPTYGTTPGGLYWKTSTSETYFYIPEFESVVIPLGGAIVVVGLLRRRAKPKGTKGPAS